MPLDDDGGAAPCGFNALVASSRDLPNRKDSCCVMIFFLIILVFSAACEKKEMVVTIVTFKHYKMTDR